ncbi:hypothetical protein SBA2_440009 [Acidobacteriia bacterium SbA2]|nr:hypothetical protein SBA2_440009 [Acidobacteriia bacterium SbA2]
MSLSSRPPATPLRHSSDITEDDLQAENAPSNIVDNAVDTHLGAPEAMMNGFPRVQFTEAQRTPIVNAQHTKQRRQSD